MLNNPKVSVVLCSNQLDDFFFKSVESILAQSFSDFELLIILNGKKIPIDSIDLIKKRVNDSRLIVFQTDVEGLTFSLNLGLHHAKSPIVARMDADDISYPERLSLQFKFLQENPDVMVCGANYNLIDANSRIIKSSSLMLDDLSIRKKMYWANPICHPTVMYRRFFALSVGGYSGDKAEDYDLWLRMLQFRQMKFVNLPMILLGYRTSDVSYARGSKLAYITMATSQLRMLFLTFDITWLFSMVVSVGKFFLKSYRQ